jgi:hypothetical protein
MNKEEFDACSKEVITRAFKHYWDVINQLGHPWTKQDRCLLQAVRKITQEEFNEQ